MSHQIKTQKLFFKKVEILGLKSVVTKIKILPESSIADLSWQKRESANFNIGKWRSSSSVKNGKTKRTKKK